MLGIEFDTATGQAPSILCLGAHSDDIEIGALGIVFRLARKYPGARVTWAVFSAIGDRRDEAHGSAAYCTTDFDSADIVLHEFKDGYFPSAIESIKPEFEKIKLRCNPNIVITHNRNDLHQDHRVISDLTWQTFRNHLILEYEIPKYDGDFGQPNFYAPLTEELVKRKLDVLEKFFASQRSKNWFTSGLFRAVMRIRGMECNSESGMAEAFYCRKLVIPQ